MLGLSFGLFLLGLSFGVLIGIGGTGGTVFVVVVVGAGVVVAGLEGVVVAVAVGVCWVARTCSDLLVSLLSVIVAGGVVWSGGTSW